jgi:SAM-dependent methyltransferase
MMSDRPRGEFTEFYSNRLHKQYFSITRNEILPDRYRVIADLVQEFSTDRIHRVLEVGVESPLTGRYLSERLEFGIEDYVGVDISETSVSRLKAEGINARCVNVSQESLDGLGTFDLVVLSEVLGHLLDPDHALDEVARVVSSTGHVVITTPNIASWFNRMSVLFGYQPFFCEASSRQSYGRALRRGSRPVGVIRPATVLAISQMVAAVGLTVLTFRGLPLDSQLGVPRLLGGIDKLFAGFPRLSAEFALIAKRQN